MHFTSQITLQQSLLSKLAKQRDRYIFHCGPTWGIKNEARMEKLLQGVIPLLQNFEMSFMPILFCYISQVIGQ